MLDTEWRCNLCGHDHEYMGDDRREEKYVYITSRESASQAAEVKGNWLTGSLLERSERRKKWRDAIRKVLLGIRIGRGRGRGRNIAFKRKEKKNEEEGDVAKGKEEKKNQNKRKKKDKKNKKNEKGQTKGVVLSSDDTYNTLEYDENGNWVLLAGEQLVRFQVEVDGAGQGSGDHEQHDDEEKEKEKKGIITDGETHTQLDQRG
ncbi:hypothetical protein QR685DRAFT_572516 [Neurospora intermedia]|uniref:Uncharacterized protein n=1 Tax=Neurospora intermedia TaxID=5142 RepID=A0ABR3DA07_NEUIN